MHTPGCDYKSDTSSGALLKERFGGLVKITITFTTLKISDYHVGYFIV